ncbi:unnamed protein product, partial [Ectocarpus fasciculatus]
VEGLVASLVRQRKVLTPSARPNFCMLMIDGDVFVSTLPRELCSRLHSSHLVPVECPIVVAASDSGVYGAGVSGEGDYSTYEGRDIEFDPPPPTTCVLTVAYIPPEVGSDGGPPEPRVKTFIASQNSQNTQSVGPSVDGVAAVFMECAPAVTFGTKLAAVHGQKPDGTSSSASGTDLTEPAGSSGPPTQPVRRSSRATTVANSKAASQRVFPKLSPPSSSVPLEGADTVFLVDDHHPLLMARTADWLQKVLGEDAVILGGSTTCALCIGSQMFPDPEEKAGNYSRPSFVVGVALRGVHALAISAKGYEGVGPVFKIDTTADPQGGPQAEKGKLLRDVTVVSSEGAAVRKSTALSIFQHEVCQASGESYPEKISLGVSASPAELLHCRPGSGRQDPDQEIIEEARGAPPIAVDWTFGEVVALDDDVTPGQHARFLRSTNRLVLKDAEAAYHACRRRVEREGGVVLSSIHFTCCIRPDRVELSGRRVQQPDGGDGDAVVTRVMALHQQEMVGLIKTLNAPAAGVFCDAEFGPVAAMSAGIHPKTAKSRFQGYTSCAAVLCWNPGSVGTKSRASSVSQGL